METAEKLAPLGFGFMRLPLTNPDDPTSIDIDKCCELVDIFMEEIGRASCRERV